MRFYTVRHVHGCVAVSALCLPLRIRLPVHPVVVVVVVVVVMSESLLRILLEGAAGAGDDPSKTTKTLQQREMLHALKAMLARSGGDRTAADKRRTPLHAAVCDRNCAVADVMQLVALRPGDLEARDYRGQMPLACAVRRLRVDVAERLLAAGASPFARSDRGLTAVHWATMSKRPELLAAVLEAAVKTGRGLRELRGSPAHCNGDGVLHTAAMGKDPGVMAVALRHMLADAHGAAELAARNVAGWTPLDIAVCQGSKATIAMLLRAGADPNLAEAESGFAPLHRVARTTYVGRVALLLQSGASPNAAKSDGFTPLHLAAINGKYDNVALLLRFGADASLRTGSAPTLPASQRSRTALDLAVAEGHDRVAALLRSLAPAAAPHPSGASATPVPAYAATKTGL